MFRTHPSSLLVFLVAAAFVACERENAASASIEPETPIAPFAAPSPNSPKDGAIITTGFRARLGWRVVPGATKYHVEVWSDDASGSLTHDLLADTTSFVLDSLNRTTYYWHVQGLSPARLTGPWSAVRRFTVLGPQ
ncbi:MAG: hypothetical protein AAB330_00715 [Bacteroidota bacterium]